MMEPPIGDDRWFFLLLLLEAAKARNSPERVCPPVRFSDKLAV